MAITCHIPGINVFDSLSDSFTVPAAPAVADAVVPTALFTIYSPGKIMQAAGAKDRQVWE